MSPQDSPRLLIAEDAIRRRVAELAQEISRDYADLGEVVLVAVLKGAFIFLADLARQLTVPRCIEFMALSSYPAGDEAKSVRLEMDLRRSIEGRHVLVVEDIVDTGRTLFYLLELLKTRSPASLRTCALVRKHHRGGSDAAVDYLGFDIPDVWVVGYGLDYAERHRTLPYIGVVEPDGPGG
ncbi:MAG: hypoxanthine phosphoribosyltransferase [Gemmatimonadales bacterium]